MLLRQAFHIHAGTTMDVHPLRYSASAEDREFWGVSQRQCAGAIPCAAAVFAAKHGEAIVYRTADCLGRVRAHE